MEVASEVQNKERFTQCASFQATCDSQHATNDT